jgi:metal-dependent hydrolase (beta-lactamase superfamily II)
MMPHNTIKQNIERKKLFTKVARQSNLRGSDNPPHSTRVQAPAVQRNWCQCVCGHQGYDNTVSPRNKRNRRIYGLIVGVHEMSTQRAQQAHLCLDDHDRRIVPTGHAKNMRLGDGGLTQQEQFD